MTIIQRYDRPSRNKLALRTGLDWREAVSAVASAVVVKHSIQARRSGLALVSEGAGARDGPA